MGEKSENLARINFPPEWPGHGPDMIYLPPVADFSAYTNDARPQPDYS